MKYLRHLQTALTPISHRFIILSALIPVVYLIAFTVVYTGKFPLPDDTYNLMMPLLLDIKSGAFSFESLVYVFNGHRPFFTLSITTLLVHFTNWNLSAEIAFLVGAGIVNAVLFIIIVTKYDKQLLPLIALPATAILLAPQYGVIWTSPIYSHWHYMTFFVFLAIITITGGKNNWTRFFLSLVLSFSALFSFAGGVSAWGIVFFLMLFYGYRKISYYLVWGVLLGVALFLYTLGTNIGVNSTAESNNQLVFHQVIPLLWFLVTYLGSTISFSTLLASTINGALLTLFLIINTVYLFIIKQRQYLPIVLSIALYPFISGVLISMSRLHYGMETAFSERYAYLSSFFLLASVVLSIVTVKSQNANRPLLHSWVVNSNLLFLLYVMGAFVFTNYMLTDTFDAVRYPVEDIARYNECMEDFPLSRIQDCGNPYFSDFLAGHNLSGYAQTPKQFVLPEPITANHKVIIATSDAWLGYHMSNWLLQGVPQEEILYYLPNADDDIIQTFWPDLNPMPIHIVQEHNPAYLDDFLAPADTIWLLSRTQEIAASNFDALVDTQEQYALFYQASLDFDIQVLGYKKIASQNAVTFTVDDTLQMTHWDIVGDYTVAPCSQITVQSYWHTLKPVEQPYAISIVLANQDGIGVNHNDAAPQIPTTQWVTGQNYLDQKQLDIPCEAGDYNILFGVYLPEPYTPIPMLSADGNPMDNLIYLTQVRVQE